MYCVLQFFLGVPGGGERGGRLFEAGRLLTFPTLRVGAYSSWALIRGWVLNRINTVFRIAASKFILYPKNSSIHIARNPRSSL